MFCLKKLKFKFLLKIRILKIRNISYVLIQLKVLYSKFQRNRLIFEAANRIPRCKLQGALASICVGQKKFRRQIRDGLDEYYKDRVKILILKIQIPKVVYSSGCYSIISLNFIFTFESCVCLEQCCYKLILLACVS